MRQQHRPYTAEDQRRDYAMPSGISLATEPTQLDRIENLLKELLNKLDAKAGLNG